jgi:hypothetical protein
MLIHCINLPCFIDAQDPLLPLWQELPAVLDSIRFPEPQCIHVSVMRTCHHTSIRKNCHCGYAALINFKARKNVVLGMSFDILLDVDGVEHGQGGFGRVVGV